jgi:putative transposase
LIHDNGGQFISLDFKRLMQSLEIQQVRTRRNHPETNGKIERMNKSVKHEAIYPNSPQSYQEACEILNRYAYEYNHQWPHAGIHYLRPADMFFGRGQAVLSERDRKIDIARANHKKRNREMTAVASVN